MAAKAAMLRPCYRAPLRLYWCWICCWELMTHVERHPCLCYGLTMKLRQHAKQQGINYRTVVRWFRAGAIASYQALTGTISVQGEKPISASTHCLTYCVRVSCAEHRANLEQQVERVVTSASGRGQQGSHVVQEIGSGVNGHPPMFLALFADPSLGCLITTHTDRGPRCGFRCSETWLSTAERDSALVKTAEHSTEDPLPDLLRVMSSFRARL